MPENSGNQDPSYDNFKDNIDRALGMLDTWRKLGATVLLRGGQHDVAGYCGDNPGHAAQWAEERRTARRQAEAE